MRLSPIVSAIVIALAALALTAQGTSAATTLSANSPKISIAPDGKDCATKGGTLITNQYGHKTCTMPTSCKVIAPATSGTDECAKTNTKSGPDRCCCLNCSNSSLPKCSFCSDPKSSRLGLLDDRPCGPARSNATPKFRTGSSKALM